VTSVIFSNFCTSVDFFFNVSLSRWVRRFRSFRERYCLPAHLPWVHKNGPHDPWRWQYMSAKRRWLFN